MAGAEREEQPADVPSDAIWEELASAGLGVYELDEWLSGGDPLPLDAFRERLAQRDVLLPGCSVAGRVTSRGAVLAR